MKHSAAVKKQPIGMLLTLLNSIMFRRCYTFVHHDAILNAMALYNCGYIAILDIENTRIGNLGIVKVNHYEHL